MDPTIRPVEAGDTAAAALLLHEFNTEFDEVTPGPEALGMRLAELLAGGDTVALVGGAGPDAVVVLRFRPALWTTGQEACLAELFVRPEHRGRGLGRALLQASLIAAVERRADWMEICVDEPDLAARALYQSAGFRNRTADGNLMFYYEREL
jgi:GNAT superfamily N-acetyltransferase